MTTMLTRAGLAVAATGFVVGVFPIHHGDVSCGNALSFNRHTSEQDIADARQAGVDPGALVALSASCDGTREPIRFAVGGLLVLGTALSIAGLRGKSAETARPD